jgi:hypothetical protein
MVANTDRTRHFTEDEIVDIAYEDSEIGELIWKSEPDIDRWRSYYFGVVKMNDDNKFYRIWWAEGNTEDCDPTFEDQDAKEVVPVTAIHVKTDYIPAEGLNSSTDADNNVFLSVPNEDPSADELLKRKASLESALNLVNSQIS